MLELVEAQRNGPIKKEDIAALRIDHDASERRATRIWPWVGAVVVVLAIAGATYLWWRGPRPAEVWTAVALERDSSAGGAETVLNATGYVTARRQATVSSKITGKLVEVRVEEGMPVEAGQLLARLDDTQYRARLALSESQLQAARRAVEETEARLRLAELTLQRTRRLVSEGVTGQADLDAAITEVEALQARLSLERQQAAVGEREVQLRRTELADTVITAPFTGVVVSKDAQPGEMVSPVTGGGGFTRTGVCTIVDMDSLEIEVDVNESYISRVQPGQQVEATLDAYPDWKIPARVIAIIPTADRQRAVVQVRVGLEVKDARILPDMGAKVAFRAQADDTATVTSRLVIPADAVRQREGRDVVFVVAQDRVERRAVTLGDVRGSEVVVRAGLSAGERIVVAGPEELADGDRVKEARR